MSIIVILILIFGAFIPYGYYLINMINLKNLEYLIPNNLPKITVVINAYKEGERVRKRMKNLIECKYPRDKIEYVIINDGKDALTELCAREYYGVPVTVFSPETRLGKITCINYMLRDLKTDIVVFTDADVTNNTEGLLHLVASLDDDTVGAVCGDVIPYGIENSTTLSEGSYRSMYGKMCEIDSCEHSCINFNGQMLAVKRIAVDKISSYGADDINIAIRCVQNGYRAVYNRKCQIYETQPVDIKSQFKQKIRRSNGLITSILRTENLSLSKMLIMRKWMLLLSPLLLVLSFICLCLWMFPIGLLLGIVLIVITFMFPECLVCSFILNQIYLIFGLIYRKNITFWNVVNK